MRKKDIAAVGGLVVVWLLPIVAVFKHGTALSSMDSFCQHFPDFLTSFRLWRYGLPLWNPLLQGGMPQLGYVESAALYPGLILFRWFSPITAYNLLLSSHWLALGLGMYVWSRAMRMSPLAAFLTAFIVQRTNLTAEHIPYSNFLCFGWMPWVGYCLTQLDKRGHWRHAAFGAVAIALPFYSGHPQYWVTWLAGCMIYTCFLIIYAEPAERRRKALLFFSVWAIAALLSLLQVFPAMAFLAEGPRSGQSTPSWVLGLHQSAPGFFGSLLLNVSNSPKFQIGPEDLHYIGFIPLLLAGRAVGGRARGTEVMAWTCSAALGFALVFGAYTGLPWIIHRLPVFSLLHSVNREALLFVYPVALLSGFGLDSLRESRLRGPLSKPSFVGALLCVLLAVPAGLALRACLDRAPGALAQTSVASDRAAIGGLVACLALLNAAIWFLARALPGKEARWALVFAVVMSFWPQLTRPSTDIQVGVPLSLAAQPPPTVSLVTALEKGSLPPARTTSFSFRDLWPGNQDERWEEMSARMISPNFSQVYGLPQIGLWHDAFTRSDFRSLGLTNDQGLLAAPSLLSPKVQLLPMLGVKYVTTRASEMPPFPGTPLPPGVFLSVGMPDSVASDMLRDQSVYSRLYADASVVLWRRKDVFPRCWFVDSVRRAALPEKRPALLGALAGQGYEGHPVDFKKEALADLPASVDPDTGSRASLGTAAITAYEPSAIRVDVKAEADDSYLVCGDAYDRGWKAAIDGKDVPVYRTNLLVRGLFVPRGRHVIEFRYRPLSVALGLAAALMGAILLLTGAAFVPL